MSGLPSSYTNTSVLLLVVFASTTVLGQSGSSCSGATSQGQCATVAGSGTNCVWQDDVSNCVPDPCIAITRQNDCLTNASTLNCLWAPWLSASGPATCVSYELLCARINYQGCRYVDMCGWRESGQYCGYAIVPASPSPTTQTGGNNNGIVECSPFPMWSIVLAVIWLFLMLILLAMIVLARRKKPMITGVERSDVVVDQVTFREDNFMPSASLAAPLFKK